MDNGDLETFRPAARMVVIGVGGGGSNAVNRMIDENIADVEFYCLNTDKQSLSQSHSVNRVVLGPRVTQGLGAGGNPDQGRAAAEDSESEIREIVAGANMVFIAAGMGGGTGTGASPLVAKIAKEEGAVVVAIVTRPFTFEGRKRIAQSIAGLNELKKEVDAIIVISNDKLLMLNGTDSVSNAFAESDRVLAMSVKTITDLILVPSIINSDFADVKNVLVNSGIALIGFGSGQGPNKAKDAALSALNCPLLEANIQGARKGICSITVGNNVTLYEAQDCVNRIIDAAGNNMDLKFSVTVNPQLDDTIVVSVIASDFPDEINFDNVPDKKIYTDADGTQVARNLNDVIAEQKAMSAQGENDSIAQEPDDERIKLDGVEEPVETSFLPNYLSGKDPFSEE